MLLLAVCCGTWAESVTYAIRSTSSVETLGTAPQGSSATFSTTYNTASQLTSGNSQTLTLSGYSGVTISKITLSMKSNSKSGAGKLSYSIDNGDNYTYIVGSSSAGVAFNDAAWYGSWSTEWVNVEKEVSITPTSSNFIIKIAATANSLYCASYSITYSTGGSQTETCETPTFSPAAGTYTEAQSVSISTATDGATIYYTTDGTAPTTSSTVFSSAINVATTTTIKAMAVKDGMNNSSVATATYSIQQPISGYNIDFESDLDLYTDWVVENVGNTNTAITAHGGSKYGANINASGNGLATASIQTKEKVANPETFTCYVSKTSGNTTASNWKVQVSEDGDTWTDIVESSAIDMEKGTWKTITANLSSYSNVYVCISYSGSTAVRAIDDISITMRDPNTKVTPNVVINASSLTNDLAGETNVSAGTVTAAVMDGQTAVENVSVTWSSSNTDVATIDATTGAVTLISTGNTTLTASFAGNDEYNEASGTYELTVIDSNAAGGANNPYTVAQARAAIDANTGVNDVYVTGIVTRNTYFSESNGTITYFISDDGTESNELEAYNGKNVGGAKFIAQDDIKVGDVVVIKGNLTLYNNTTYELASGNELVSLDRKEVKYYLAGSWGENDYGWGEGMEQLTKSGNTYTISKNLADGTLFKIVKVDETNNNTTTWYGGPADGEWFGVSETVYEDLTLSSSGKNFKIEGTCDDAFTFTVDATDADNLKLTVTGWHQPVVKYYLAGNWTENWGDGKVELTENTDGTFSTSKLVGNGTRFKFVKTVDDAESWYGATRSGEDWGIHSEACTDIALGDASDAAAFQIQMAEDNELVFNLNADNMTFSVSGWPISLEGNMFVKVTSDADFTDGAYLIVNETAGVAFDGSLGTLDATDNVISVTIDDGKIVADATTKASLFTIVGGGKIISASGHYIGVSNYGNGLVQDNATYYNNSVTVTNGNADIAINAGGSNYVHLKYNKASDQNRFRYYKTGQQDIQLYKLVTLTAATATIAEACTDGTKYYGTYSNTSAFILPEGVTASEISVIDGELLVEDYAAGAIVPANTGVMISSETAGEKTFYLTTGGESVLGEDNMLRPTGEGITADAMAEEDPACLYYRLTMHNGETIGFWWGAAEGAAFNVAANKAYLAVPTETASKIQGFTFGNGGDATEIVLNALKGEQNGVMYNLQGQKVGSEYKGIVIVNGKKVMVK